VTGSNRTSRRHFFLVDQLFLSLTGYTQSMVVDSARIVTGWTVGRHGEFAYYNDWHYVGPVSVLGFSAAKPGDVNGWIHRQFLDVAACLSAFATDLGAGLSNVTVVTLTEFGRRAQENGSDAGGAGHR
jgi:uncharacterized protein (DUF1501 family)